MRQFQKIAIGLLGLTHPELFVPMSKAPAAGADGPGRGARLAASGPPAAPAEGRAVRLVRALKFLLAALAVGSRTVPLADNRALVRELAGRARCLYGP